MKEGGKEEEEMGMKGWIGEEMKGRGERTKKWERKKKKKKKKKKSKQNNTSIQFHNKERRKSHKTYREKEKKK